MFSVYEVYKFTFPVNVCLLLHIYVSHIEVYFIFYFKLSHHTCWITFYVTIWHFSERTPANLDIQLFHMGGRGGGNCSYSTWIWRLRYFQNALNEQIDNCLQYPTLNVNYEWQIVKNAESERYKHSATHRRLLLRVWYRTGTISHSAL